MLGDSQIAGWMIIEELTAAAAAAADDQRLLISVATLLAVAARPLRCRLAGAQPVPVRRKRHHADAHGGGRRRWQ